VRPPPLTPYCSPYRSPYCSFKPQHSCPFAEPCLPQRTAASTARAAHRNAPPQGCLHARDRTDTGERARQAWQ
jgi:hypothetical protein